LEERDRFRDRECFIGEVDGLSYGGARDEARPEFEDGFGIDDTEFHVHHVSWEALHAITEEEVSCSLDCFCGGSLNEKSDGEVRKT